MSLQTALIPQWSLCSKCEKYFEDKVPMKVGDKVKFTNVTQKGQSVRFSSCEGKIDEIGEFKVRIIYRKKQIIKKISEITTVKSKNGLTVSFKGVCECKDPKSCS